MFNEVVNGFVRMVVPWAVLLAVISAIITVLGTFLKLLWLPTIKGRLCEVNINFWIRRMLDQAGVHLIPDV